MLDERPILELDAAEPDVDEEMGTRACTLRMLPGAFALIESRDRARAEIFGDMCCGILRLASGRACFLGRDWAKTPTEHAAAMRGRIGRVFAGGGWMAFRDMPTNILLPQLHHTRRDRAALREAAAELGRTFGLPGLPLGRPSELSGADLARAACVRALLCEPLLLLLESPVQAQYADLVPPLLNAAATVRDRGGAVIWMTRSDLVWNDRSMPATLRLRLQDHGLHPVRGR